MKRLISLSLLLIAIMLCISLASCFGGGEEYYVYVNRGYLYGEQYGYDNVTIEYKNVKEGTVLEEPELPEFEGYTFAGWKIRNTETEDEAWWSFDTPISNDTIASYLTGNDLHIEAVFTREQFAYTLTDDGTGYIATELLYMPYERIEEIGCDVMTITVPDTYRGLPVVAIADGACELDSANSVGIWGQAEKLTIGKNVTYIGARAFAGRVRLYDAQLTVVIPDGVTEIGEGAFEGCSLGQVILPDSLTKIDANTFQYCGLGSAIVIPDGVTYIGPYAFANTHITSADKDGSYPYDVVVPDTVTEIGEYAFYESRLTSVKLSANVTSVAPQTFAKCENLTAITIPEGVTSIEPEAFMYSGVSSVSLPSTLKYIGKEAFSLCTSLQSITIPEGVEYIGEQAFYYSSSLTTVELPTTLTYIGAKTFEYTLFMTNLQKAAGDYSDQQNLQDCVYYGSYLFKTNTVVSEPKIKEGTVLIASGAFEGYKNMTGITIPDTVKYIGDRAFYQCENLATISLPDSVLTIGVECFAWCSSLSNIRLSESLTELPYYAFAGCALGDVVIPDSVTTLGAYVFYKGGVTSVNIPAGITAIPSYAFYNCWLGDLVIPETVLIVMDYAFYTCHLTSLTLPSTSSLYIMNSAFEGNIEITELFIPATVTMIDPAAFYGCTGLVSVTFGATSGGWRCVNMNLSATQGGVKQFTIAELSDAETAAKYLTKDYAGYTWSYYKEEA